MSDKLTHFLIDLASDPVRMDAFQADPAGMLATSLLTGEEQSAVLTRDGHRVRSALGFSLAPEPVAVMKKRPPTLKDQSRNDPAKPAANKQRKPGSKKGSPAARKGGRK